MGVTGSGKTTIGRKLAEEWGCPFYDADDFHSAANKEKMSRGISLTDEDRMPWLEKLKAEIGKWNEKNTLTVLACSALKQKYRDLLSQGNAVQWIYLKGDRETIQKRIESRKGHFAGLDLLESQMTALEEPKGALQVDVRKDPATIIREIVQSLKGTKLI